MSAQPVTPPRASRRPGPSHPMRLEAEDGTLLMRCLSCDEIVHDFGTAPPLLMQVNSAAVEHYKDKDPRLRELRALKRHEEQEES